MSGTVFYFNWEVSFIEWLQRSGTAGAGFASFFTLFGEETFLVLIFGLFYWCINKKAAKEFGTSLITACIVNPMIKNLVLRNRPYIVHESIKCLKPVDAKADLYDVAAQGYSFPSQHAMNSVVLYGSIARLWKKPVVRVLLSLLILLIGVSRTVVGVHYPTDVLTGWVLGFGLLFLFSFLQGRVKNRNLLYLIVFLLSCTGIIFCRTDDYFTGLGMMGGLFLGFSFEEKYVGFEETRNILECVIRVAGGMIVFLGLNTLLKLPFSKEFLTGGTLPAFLIRSLRYMIVVFLMFGIYPMLFKKIRFGKREKKSNP